jgi:type IV secretion system protein VirB6
MACPAVITGDAFVTRVITHIDCQAGYLGSYGYQSLADPGSPAAVLMSGLLTLFVALWGLRLLFGPNPAMRDVVLDVLKIGIVLTLAFSWPAFRTIIHDVVLNGPAEIASTISTPGLTNSGAGFVERLQAADNAIVNLTEAGTGRRSGQYIDPDAAGGTFEAVALEDESALGWARVAWLVGLIGTLALLRIAAGLLLALAPVAAGLLLFRGSRGVFFGWLRGLVFAIASAVAVTFTLGIELAILEPWLADALRVRQLGYATPAAPVELLAMALAFAVVHLGIVWFIARVCFHSDLAATLAPLILRDAEARPVAPAIAPVEQPAGAGRVEALANHIETRVRQEQGAAYYARVPAASGFERSAAAGNDTRTEPVVTNGPGATSGFRRAVRSPSLSSTRRDRGR